MADIQQILIYDDDVARSRRFLPLTYTRPVAALRSGLFTGIERVRARYPNATLFLTSTGPLQTVSEERYGVTVNRAPEGEILILNSREILGPHESWEEEMTTLSHDFSELIEAGQPLELRSGAKPTALWDLVHNNTTTLESDLSLLLSGESELRAAHPDTDKNALIVGEVYVHPTAYIGPGAILDGTDGPIVLEANVRIMPGAVLIGPVCIGRGSIVKALAKIYEGTTVGPVCKVGGEVENSIFQGFSNKQHDGYVGHSYIGEWCNLGADTNTSDLKNDYSAVRVTIEDEEINTESMFVGLMMGDHSKSAINTQFNTGTAVGVSCNVFDAGFPPKWIPNFSWGGASSFVDYRFEKALRVAQIVTERRNVTLSEAETQLLRSLYNAKHRTTT